MKKANLTIAVVIACLSVSILSSCRFNCVHGSGKLVTEQRKANDFKKIEITGAFKIHLKQDSSSSITVIGDDNLLKYVSTSVDGDKLTIKSTKSMCFDDSLIVTVGIRQLNEIKSSGAVDLLSIGKITANDLKIGLSGASKANLDLSVANLSTHSSGVAKLSFKGQAASYNLESSGLTKINAFDFVVGDYTISTSGASECKINVLKTLNVHSSGASEIDYKGSPSTVNNDKSGASKIKKVD
ncbi:MAG: hypothetical protein JWR38_2186 [Mucilaginibacter sp.]|nr:hypothetical protein [Mucilaginibacter sp.]